MQSPPGGTSQGRIPGLDGLRAVSILAVLFAHLLGTRGFLIDGPPYTTFKFGTLGVTVFFVISGYLITNLLLRECRETGTISLLNFYIRRAVRIFPAYYAFLLLMVLADRCGLFEMGPSDFLAAFTYTMNYRAEHSWLVGHTWSLAVEEQFYLLWPLTLLLCGVRRAVLLAAGVVALAPLVRVAIFYAGGPAYEPLIGHSFETTADAIAIGCVLAVVQRRLWVQPLYRRFMHSRLFPLVPLTALAMSGVMGHPLLNYLITNSIMIVAIALTVDWCVTFPEGRIGRILNSVPMVYLGGLSYSLYLWQQPFLQRTSASPLCRFPLNIILAIVAALLSYYCIERPGLRLRRHLEQRREQRAASLNSIIAEGKVTA